MSTIANLVQDNIRASGVEDTVSTRTDRLVDVSQLHGVHWLVVGLSLLLTIAAWHISREQVNRASEERFLREAEQVVQLVTEEMKLYEGALWSATSLISANGGKVDYPLWLRYANSLRMEAVFPGIHGIGVILNVMPDELDDYLAQQRMWRPHFDIHPSHDEAEYWPITYIEPEGSNSKAVGLDMAFESNRHEAIKKSRDSGLAQVTGPITLVQDAKKTPGFLFFAPFYQRGGTPATDSERRENIGGVAYAPFIMHNMINSKLSMSNRQVTVRITDQDKLLYEDGAVDGIDVFDPDPLFEIQTEVAMYGRQWRFHLAAARSFREANANNQPRYILLGGIIIDALLLSLFLFLTRANRRALRLSRANQRAVRYADQITEKLKQEKARLEKSNHDLEQFAYVASHDLKAPLNAIDKLVGWFEEDLGDQIPETSQKHMALLRNRTNRMSTLLDDLLSFSRVGRYDYKAEQVRLKDMVEDNYALLDKPENFVIEAEDVELNVPRVPFELVLRNLISNAIKHHDRDTGTVRVSARFENDHYVLRIVDDGPGIPPELHQRALEMFRCLQSADRVEGNGMGLPMARRIVEHYRGGLEIESGGVRGTTIVIHWPANGEQG